VLNQQKWKKQTQQNRIKYKQTKQNKTNKKCRSNYRNGSSLEDTSEKTKQSETKQTKQHQNNNKLGQIIETVPSLEETRESVLQQLYKMRPDHLRATLPTQYKVSVSEVKKSK
jgi:hypothetical protein